MGHQIKMVVQAVVLCHSEHDGNTKFFSTPLQLANKEATVVMLFILFLMQDLHLSSPNPFAQLEAGGLRVT